MKNLHGKLIAAILVFVFSGISFYAGYQLRFDGEPSTDNTNEEKFNTRINKLKKDKDFYSSLDYYSSLLKSNEDYLHIYNKVKELRDDDGFEDLIKLTAADYLMRQNQESEKIITNLKKKVDKLNSDVELNKKERFEKNANCADLKSGIKDGLNENESLLNVFYSIKENSCFYSVSESNQEGGIDDLYSDYRSRRYYYIYNANNENEVGEFKVYDTKLTDTPSGEEQMVKNRKEYVRQILEHSGYDVSLLEDVNYTSFFK